ncbi:cysteine-rich receptor-like protein kinase 26 isoform X2 [Cucumis melo]|uniref:Cysteine-rich receptor-like protein kinase 26 isoform X2 n=1 Tax=Cucumis melo TaxID=3656 RepID=A0ABM3KDX7_CUCME|nr:cysteine-rich receptor-like protein kinase 26 isoform X2 [Cucumis melo]
MYIRQMYQFYINRCVDQEYQSSYVKYIKYIFISKLVPSKVMWSITMAVSEFVCSITLSLSFFLLIHHPLAFAQPRFAHYICVDGGNNNHTTDGEAYKANLNHLLSTLTSDHLIDYGFYNLSSGIPENRAYVIGLCRGDISADSCRRCLNDSRDLLPLRCPTQNEAIGWYVTCMLRYSNRPILGSMEVSPFVSLSNSVAAPDQAGFTKAARNLIANLIGPASDGDSRLKFAMGNTTLPNLPTIYGLAQCTPDLSRQQCNECLVGALPIIRNCCDGKLGSRVLRPSCNFRYEIYSFIESPLSRSPLPLPPPPPPPLSPVFLPLNRTTHGNKNGTFIAVALPITLVVVITPMITIYIFVRKTKPKKTDGKKRETEEEMTTMGGFLQFDFNIIKMATDEFSDENKVGEGGFGAVYKGKLPNGRIVAVKRLRQASRHGDVEFRNEVVLLSKLHHRNLVKLLGFSLKQNEKLLVYEFLHNGSLHTFIFDPLNRQTFHWTERYNVIQGIVRGLVYLHEDSQINIVHRDLKASNILLDVKMNAKISDFGIARLFTPDRTHDDTSTIIGTYGYMAPEYVRHGHLSSKLDIFSFGVLVLEIVTGRKNNRTDSNNENVRDHLISEARRNWMEGTPLNIVDPSIQVQSEISDEVMKCIRIGLHCVQEKASERPTMTTILLMLNSDLVDFFEPSQPAYFTNTKTPT